MYYVTSATSKSKELALEPYLWCNIQPRFHTWPPAGGDTVLYCTVLVRCLVCGDMLMWCRCSATTGGDGWGWLSIFTHVLYSTTTPPAALNSPRGATRAYTQNKLARSKYISIWDSLVCGSLLCGWAAEARSHPQDLHPKQQFSI